MVNSLAALLLLLAINERKEQGKTEGKILKASLW
jgi:hypothetical protein